jgi:hypothetical protein
MADNLSVSISADTTDLQARLAVASSQVRTFGAEVRKLAASYSSAGDDMKGGLLAGLETSIQKADQARAQVSALSSSLSSGGIKEGLASIGLNAREATTGIARMGEELASGNIVGAAPHVAMLALRLGSVSPALLAATAGFGVFAGALAYGATEAVRMESAIAHLADIAAAMGEGNSFGLDQSRALMSTLVEQFGLSVSEAEKVATAVKMIGAASDEQQAKIAVLAVGIGRALNIDPGDAAKTLAAGMMQGVEGVDKLIERYKAWSDADAGRQHAALDTARGMEAAGAKQEGSFNAIGVAISALTARFGGYTDAAQQAARATSEAWEAAGSPGAVPDTAPPTGRPGASQKQTSDQEHLNELLGQANVRLAKEAALRSQINELTAQGGTAGGSGSASLALSDRQHELDQMLLADHDAEISKSRDAAEAAQSGSAQKVSALQAELAAMQAAGVSEQALGKQRAATAAAEREEGANSARIAVQAADTAIKAKQKQVEEELRLVEAYRSEGRITAETATAEKRSLAAEEHGQISAGLQAEKGTPGLTPDELATINNKLLEEDARYAEEVAGIDREGGEQRAADARKISQEIAQTNLEASRLAVEASKSQYAQQLTDGQIGLEQYKTLMQSALQEELAAQLAAIDAEHANDVSGTVQHQAGLDQQRLAYLRYTQAVEELAQQSADKQKEINQKLASDLQSTFQPINQYWQTVMDSMLDRTKNSTQQIEQAFSKMVTSYIEDVAKMLAHWLAFQAATSLGWTKIAGAVGNPFSSSSGGMGALFGELLGGGATGGGAGGAGASVLGSAGRLAAAPFGAAGGASDTAALTLNTTALTTITPPLTALAPAMTSLSPAITTLDASFTTLDASFTTLDADMLGLTAAVEANTAALASSSAGSGAGGALGLTGDLVPSFDVGSWHIPHDTLAMVHQGEMVLPAGDHAETGRKFFSGRGVSQGTGGLTGPSAGGSVSGGHTFVNSPTIHVHPSPGQSLQPADIAAAIGGEMRRFSKFLRP